MGIHLIVTLKLRCDEWRYFGECKKKEVTFVGSSVRNAKQNAVNKGWYIGARKCKCPDCADKFFKLKGKRRTVIGEYTE